MSAESLTYRLGTRKSHLATTQSKFVQKLLEQHGVKCALVEIDSDGDKDRLTPLYEIEAEAPGLFTKHLEKALLDRTIDLAVHSLKDLPTDQPASLIVAAVLARKESADCVLVRTDKIDPKQKYGLPKGIVLGTSSLRREALWKSERPDIVIQSIRGNVPTRVEKVRKGEIDAVMIARAGLERLQLGLEELTRIDLPEDVFVSSPGQGALAVETREDAPQLLREALRQIHHPIVALETRLERQVLKGLHGGCTLPLGVRCRYDESDKSLQIKAFLGEFHLDSNSQRQWNRFHRFDFSHRRADTLVEKTITHFKEAVSARS